MFIGILLLERGEFGADIFLLPCPLQADMGEPLEFGVVQPLKVFNALADVRSCF
jgi:hypothetical protein